MWKAFDNFFETRNASPYTEVHYWMVYVNFFFMYATSTAIRTEVMRFKNLKQLPRKTEAEFSSWVNKIAYQCENASLVENKISTRVFRLQYNVQTINVHGTKELDNNRRSFEHVFK